MRRNARSDSTQREVVEAFRAGGASVRHLHMVGGDLPDLIVGYMGVNVLVEVKRRDGPPSKRRLTQGQQQFRDTWRGPVAMVTDTQGAMRLLRVIEAAVIQAAQGFIQIMEVA